MRIILVIALTAFLVGCESNSSLAMLEDYRKRMANVLDIEVQPDTQAYSLATFPDKRDRIQKTTEVRQGLWEVLDFRKCDMLSMISERNSSLGKVMPASYKMRYELKFLDALTACQSQLTLVKNPDETQTAFLERLGVIIEVKRSNLGAEIWNGIYGSDEVAKQFKSSNTPLLLQSEEPLTTITPPSDIFEKFLHLASLTQEESFLLPSWLDSLEQEYERLHTSEMGPKLLASLLPLSSHLDAVAAAIEARLKRQPFCFKGHQPPRAAVLNTVFRKHYVDKVQPYMARVEQLLKPWFSQQQALMTRLPSTPAMQDYAWQVYSTDNPKSLWNRWIAARNRHTKAWQTILGQCNMMPGKH